MKTLEGLRITRYACNKSRMLLRYIPSRYPPCRGPPGPQRRRPCRRYLPRRPSSRNPLRCLDFAPLTQMPEVDTVLRHFLPDISFCMLHSGLASKGSGSGARRLKMLRPFVIPVLLSVIPCCRDDHTDSRRRPWPRGVWCRCRL